MKVMLTEEELKKAQKRVRSKKEFYQHLVTFLIINIFLWAINMLTTPSYAWFLFATLSWGVGLALHYVSVFGIPGYDFMSTDWEKKELEKEIDKISQQKYFGAKANPDPDVLDLKEIKKVYKDTDFV